MLSYLKIERGLSEETIKAPRLGWNPKDAWPARKSWGLPEELKKDGKPKKLWIPAGIVIPCYACEALQRVRIRRQNPTWGPPYVLLSGSNSSAMILGANRNIFVIVESELDGILLSQEIGNMAGVVALGNAQARPGKGIADLLRKAVLILVALDDDSKKEKNTGAQESWNWWLKQFEQAKRWPPIEGKDPGEVWKNGVNLQMWIQAGIEEYQIKQESMAEPSAMETSLDLESSMPVTTDDPGQNFIIKLHSDLTCEDFYLCSTQRLKDECRANDPDTVVYLPHEIRNLSGLKPDELKKLHHARKLFGGEIIFRNKIEDSVFFNEKKEEIKNIGIYNPRLLKLQQ